MNVPRQIAPETQPKISILERSMIVRTPILRLLGEKFTWEVSRSQVKMQRNWNHVLSQNHSPSLASWKSVSPKKEDGP
jgi:hypothetical protein